MQKSYSLSAFKVVMKKACLVIKLAMTLECIMDINCTWVNLDMDCCIWNLFFQVFSSAKWSEQAQMQANGMRFHSQGKK